MNGAAPEMPDWAPPDGPWCLTQWIMSAYKLLTGEEQSVVTCLREPDHEGDCRDQFGLYRRQDEGDIPIGKLLTKEQQQ